MQRESIEEQLRARARKIEAALAITANKKTEEAQAQRKQKLTECYEELRNLLRRAKNSIRGTFNTLDRKFYMAIFDDLKLQNKLEEYIQLSGECGFNKDSLHQAYQAMQDLYDESCSSTKLEELKKIPELNVYIKKHIINPVKKFHSQFEHIDIATSSFEKENELKDPVRRIVISTSSDSESDDSIITFNDDCDEPLISNSQKLNADTHPAVKSVLFSKDLSNHVFKFLPYSDLNNLKQTCFDLYRAIEATPEGKKVRQLLDHLKENEPSYLDQLYRNQFFGPIIGGLTFGTGVASTGISFLYYNTPESFPLPYMLVCAYTGSTIGSACLSHFGEIGNVSVGSYSNKSLLFPFCATLSTTNLSIICSGLLYFGIASALKVDQFDPHDLIFILPAVFAVLFLTGAGFATKRLSSNLQEHGLFSETEYERKRKQDVIDFHEARPRLSQSKEEAEESNILNLNL
jgi:hypothetical protein